MTTSKVALYKGLPTLFLNDEPLAPVAAYVGPHHTGTFAQAGIQLYTFSVRGTWWLGPGEYDFSAIDAFIADYVARIPEGYFMPRIDLARQGHPWWGELHPEEMVVLRSIETGEPISPYDPDPRVVDYLGHEVHLEALNLHSFHSEVWRREAAQAVYDLIAHCEAQPYAERLWAWHLCDGLFCEWFHWNEYNFAGMADYSPAAVADFRRWLRATYKNDLAALRRAWGKPDVTFENAEIPLPQERAKAFHYDLYHPVINRPTIDYHQCMSDATVDCILAVCQAAKRALPQPKVTCVFYGYQFSNMPRPQLNGHYALQRLLASDAVDMIASPHCYGNRGEGGYHAPQSLAETIRRAGKIHFDEIDCKTVWTPPTVTWKRHISQPTTVEGTIEMLKKDAAYAIASGTAQWWMDLTDQGWFDAPELVEPLRKLRGIAERVREMEPKSFGEIALVVSQRAMMYLPPREGLHNAVQKMLRNWHLSRVGAPFDLLTVEELTRPDVPRYKLYIMANLFYLSERERAILADILQTGLRKTALWMYAPALLTDADTSLGSMEYLTGLRFGAEAVEAELDVEIIRNDHPITQGLPIGMRYGTGVDREQYLLPPKIQYLPETKMTLHFYVQEGWGETLGLSCATGKPGLVVRELGGLQSVYSAAPVLSWQVLRNIAQYAGVHLYTEGGHMVWGNDRFLAIYAQGEGDLVVRFPKAVDVEDAYEDRLLGQKVTRLTLPMKKWETRLLILK